MRGKCTAAPCWHSAGNDEGGEPATQAAGMLSDMGGCKGPSMEMTRRVEHTAPLRRHRTGNGEGYNTEQLTRPRHRRRPRLSDGTAAAMHQVSTGVDR